MMGKKLNWAISPEAAREEHLYKKYGLSLDAYKALEEAQNFSCKICGLSKTKNKHGVLEVDHDHTSGKIRGLLCSNCNRGLGSFKDNRTSLLKAIQYLKGNL